MSDCTRSNAFLEWIEPFMNDELAVTTDIDETDQLDMFKGEHLTADSEPAIKPA